MKSENIGIIYSGFWDFPLAFTTRWEGCLYLFFREFDDDQDEYEDHYRVYLLPSWTDDEIKSSWSQIPAWAKSYLGEVAVKDISFDATHRQEINAAILQTLTMPREVVGTMR